MKNLTCAICGQKTPFEILFPASFKRKQINKGIFSARRTPDRCHCRIVRCRKCGLIFSNPFLREKAIHRLYQESELTYGPEIGSLKKTYGNYLKKIINFVPEKNNLLEIGCGNGFFLKEALKLGFKNVWGVEPSVDAVNKADSEIKPFIKLNNFQAKLFKNNFFDVICFFQTLDHIINPNLFLNDCFKILKRQGIIFCIVHNSNSFLTKILGEKTPIFDIEHTYLYDKSTLRKIFEKNNFEVIKVINTANEYSLRYWFSLLPLGIAFKKGVEKVISLFSLEKISLRIKAGNIVIVAKKAALFDRN